MPSFTSIRFVVPFALAGWLTPAILFADSGELTSSVAFEAFGEATFDNLGFSVRSAGDVNGDTYDDVIVGAQRNGAAGTFGGRAYVFFGGEAPDSIPDLVLTAEAAGDFFGVAVDGAGDVNGDGFDDVIVGAYRNDSGGADAGRAYLYFGGATPDTTADLVFSAQAAGDRFGWAVAGAGDVNGDTYGDVIVGAYSHDSAGPEAGRAYLYFGGAMPDTTADVVLTGEEANDFFGISVAAAGDLNGDTFDDVIVGAYLNDAGGDAAGRAYVYWGGAVPDSSADLTLTGAAPGDRFGYSVSRAGRVNLDGFDDVMVGAYHNDVGGSESGQVYVYYGGVTPDPVPDLVLTGEAVQDRFGYAVGSAGDVNGDGHDDLVVGAYLNDAGGTESGRAYLFLTGACTDSVPDLILTGASGSNFGVSVSCAGDIDRDGQPEIVIGAWNDDSTGNNAGRMVVLDVLPNAATSVGPATAVVSRAHILGPWPNPGAGARSFSVELPRATTIVLSLHDVTGRLLAKRSPEQLPRGRQTFTWDPGTFPPGVYFLQTRAFGSVTARKWIVRD